MMNGYSTELFVWKPSEELLCGICLEVLNNPHQCTSGHLFCLSCIKQAMAIKKKCPICKINLSGETLGTNMYVRNTINRLVVKCCLEPDKCQWTGPLEQLKAHQSGCQFSKPPEATCIKVVPKENRHDTRPTPLIRSRFANNDWEWDSDEDGPFVPQRGMNMAMVERYYVPSWERANDEEGYTEIFEFENLPQLPASRWNTTSANVNSTPPQLRLLQNDENLDDYVPISSTQERLRAAELQHQRAHEQQHLQHQQRLQQRGRWRDEHDNHNDNNDNNDDYQNNYFQHVIPFHNRNIEQDRRNLEGHINYFHTHSGSSSNDDRTPRNFNNRPYGPEIIEGSDPEDSDGEESHTQHHPPRQIVRVVNTTLISDFTTNSDYSPQSSSRDITPRHLSSANNTRNNTNNSTHNNNNQNNTQNTHNNSESVVLNRRRSRHIDSDDSGDDQHINRSNSNNNSNNNTNNNVNINNNNSNSISSNSGNSNNNNTNVATVTSTTTLHRSLISDEQRALVANLSQRYTQAINNYTNNETTSGANSSHVATTTPTTHSVDTTTVTPHVSSNTSVLQSTTHDITPQNRILLHTNNSTTNITTPIITSPINSQNYTNTESPIKTESLVIVRSPGSETNTSTISHLTRATGRVFRSLGLF